MEEPSGDGVRVTVASAGVCGSDLHLVDRWPIAATLGHEFAGTLDDGRVVAVEPIGACGTCRECLEGRRSHCESVRLYGVAENGGMADRCIVPESSLVLLPSGLAPADASLVEPLAVAVHAVRRLGSVAGEEVAVIGGGAIGLCAVAALYAAGAGHVALVARHDAQRSAGERLGAQLAELEPSRWTAVIDAAGTAESLAESVRSCRPTGRVGMVGTYWEMTIPMPAMELCTKEVSLVPAAMYGSSGGSRDVEVAAALLARRPEIAATLITHRFPLDAAVEAFAVARDRAAGAIKVVLEP